jgi:hypothetical protein
MAESSIEMGESSIETHRDIIYHLLEYFYLLDQIQINSKT